MLRLTELKLPLDHPADALRAAILQRLELKDDELLSVSIFKRSHDARKKHALLLIYAVDIEVKNEAALLKKFRTDRHLAPTPAVSPPTAAPVHVLPTFSTRYARATRIITPVRWRPLATRHRLC